MNTQSMPSEEALIASAPAGSHKAFGELVRQRFDRGYKIPIRVRLHDVGTGAGLDDVTQKSIRKM